MDAAVLPTAKFMFMFVNIADGDLCLKKFFFVVVFIHRPNRGKRAYQFDLQSCRHFVPCSELGLGISSYLTYHMVLI